MICRLCHITIAGHPPPPLAASQNVFPGAEALVSSEQKLDDILISDISNGIEALGNLIYLICEDSDHPSRVRQYASMCEERLRILAGLMVSRANNSDLV